MSRIFSARRAAVAALATSLLVLGLLPAATRAGASHTPAPGTVTVVGSLQSALGCPGDWQPGCAATHLTYDAADEVWQATFTLPAGFYEYKVAINDSWDENYGLHATQNGANIPLNLAAATAVKFYYSHGTHWVTDSVSSIIATVPGSYQSELGCPGDWAEGCLRSWLQDPEGDGTYAFEATGIPAGSYEAKVAINESWNENYGAGGVQNGPNIPFAVTAPTDTVRFAYDAVSHLLTITVTSVGPSADNNVEWAGIRHDSRDLLYRTPGGTVPTGSDVRLRLRAFHDDLTAVTLRTYDTATRSQQLVPMKVAASGVSCYQPELADSTCDFWEATVTRAALTTLWYRFVVRDGTDTDYYADGTAALDGGLGAVTDDPVDWSYALSFVAPSASAPAWVGRSVIYQVFPDRFRNGDPTNDPKTGTPRYADPVLALPWGTLPEGYCRNYTDAGTSCPWRFDSAPPADVNPTIEEPRGRDYFGGDLAGLRSRLNYLKDLGVTTVYLNPIFEAKSNHRYDTADYLHIDRALGSESEFKTLVSTAKKFGIRLVLDGVFNHMSSDSPFFDRYHRYPQVGACESAGSLWRSWFTFRPPGPDDPATCAPSAPGGADTYYNGWFGFDTIPVLDKSQPSVSDYFVTGPGSVTNKWTKTGIGGWRMDVMGDSSFPAGYWQTFRSTVKGINPDAVIISETWQKDSTLLDKIAGDQADTTMNYRLRDAVLGLLAPGPFDSKGFPDSGREIQPSEFASRLASVREDYSNAAYYSLMNLLDSHDTERALWTLTPGSETAAAKELNAANLAEGKQRLRLASLIQFGVPGAPTVYYGDEVGVTGDDDPDDRRTYPWADLGGSPDTSLQAHYAALGKLKQSNDALVHGDFRVLLADDADGTVAFGRKTGQRAAIVAVNRSSSSRSVTIPVAGYLPNGVALSRAHAAGTASPASVTTTSGAVTVQLGPLSGVLLTSAATDLTPPSAPTGLQVTAEGDGQVALSWAGVSGAASYDVYRSPLSGGGFVEVGSATTATTFHDTGVDNGRRYFYVVTARDAKGNESAWSNQVEALPHLTIGWANLQWPPTLTHTISTVNRTANVYGQVWIDGHTNQAGPTPTLRAQLGYGPDGSDPAGNAAWRWVDAAFNVDSGNSDEFAASLLPDQVGSFDYAYRYTTTAGRDWVYADVDGTGNGYSPAQAGALTVEASGDTTAPAAPTGLRVVSASPEGIALAWDAVDGDASLDGYEVRRATVAGGPYTTLARVSAPSYTDPSVASGTTYHYVVRAVDTSFNRSADSDEVSATAELRTVSVAFHVTVPSTTDATARPVVIAGSLDRLDGDHPSWDPAAVQLTRVDATHWTITLSGREATQIEYKYTLGSWENVEKDDACGEIANRQLTLSYGATGTQVVNDTVQNWRNVAPCGN